MTSVSIHSSSRWAMRVLGGTSAGSEFPLRDGRLILGAAAGAQIQIAAPGIASRQCELIVNSRGISVSPLASGALLNGAALVGTMGIGTGDVLTVGAMQLQFVDSLVAIQCPNSLWARLISRQPGWIQLSGGIALLATLLLVMTLITGNLKLVPITTLVCAAVVPVGMLAFVYSKYGPAAASIRSMTITVGLGATLGLVVTLLLAAILPIGGSALVAPIVEEPAKLIATIWCWRRLGYSNPLSGLVLGLAAGTGFAVAETAGYVFEAGGQSGLGSGLQVLLLRSILAPFGHGVWTACAASAWFQVSWSFRGAWQPIFLRALLFAIGLHFLWNASLFTVPLVGVPLSIFASSFIFRALLRSRGTWRAVWAATP